jgi:hypothetical protein
MAAGSKSNATVIETTTNSLASDAYFIVFINYFLFCSGLPE